MSKSIGTLYTVDQQPQGKAIKAIAAYAGLKFDTPENYTHYETNKTEAFTSKFISGKIPALETTDGLRIFESQAIIRYVSGQAKLLGSSAHEAALVDQWITFTGVEVAHPLTTAIQLCMGRIQPYNKPIEQHFREKGLHALSTLEKHLATQTYLVGERISGADIFTAVILQSAYAHILDPAHRSSNPNLLRFTETILNHPKLKSIFGPLQCCEKTLAYTPPAKPAKEDKPAASTPAPKKEAKTAKEAEDDDDDGIPRDEPKAKNPLDSLPKSDFNLEDWKRAYSNMDTRGSGGSIEWFHSKFDKEGFSVWKVDFKYNDELTQVFMSSNQIGGFFNRLEASRKYLFGSVGVLGTANNSVISGVFICRGKDIKPVVDCAPDYESYDYTALDLGNTKDKEFFEAALAWDLEQGNLKWADGKNFK